MKKRTATMFAPQSVTAAAPLVTFPSIPARLHPSRTAVPERCRNSVSHMNPVVAPPQFSSYIVTRRRKMNVLVCEDADTFARVRMLMHKEHQRRFFGVRFDGVVYLRREDLANSGSLREVQRYLCSRRRAGSRQIARRSIRFLVWGDVSRPGINRMLQVYQACAGMDVHAFLPAYRCMLDLAYGRTLPREQSRPASSFGLRLAAKLGECQKQTLRQVVEDQLIIPQSMVSTRILRRRARG